MYAIVDIETTGGHASANGITEIAVLIHDGNHVVHHYETLINPGIPVPVYIRALTGIHDGMLADAPEFKDVASEIYELLCDKIFVAHNVNFDYSFLKHHLSLYGFDLQCKKLCTVRLCRKIFPGLSSYSLGKLCSHLNILNDSRHRAAGDAKATATLFTLLLQKDSSGYVDLLLNGKLKEQQLPPGLCRDDIDALPSTPGVYYFKDSKGRVIYVGKAVNIKKRVVSHFTGNNPGRQRQEFLKNICSVSYEPCGTELMAFILEAIEIKRLWPSNNRAMKRYEQLYGLYSYEDQRGYSRLMIDKRRKNSFPLFSFNSLSEGRNILMSLVRKFELCPKLCFIQVNNDPCTGISNHYCRGVCEGNELYEDYNARVAESISYLKVSSPSFLLVDKGRNNDEKGVILMEQGNLYGMGYVPSAHPVTDLGAVKVLLNPCPSNDYIRNLILDHASRFPWKVVSKSKEEAIAVSNIQPEFLV